MAESTIVRPSPIGMGRSYERELDETPPSHVWSLSNPALQLIAFTAAVLAVYWNTLEDASVAWEQDLYSHGWIVPILAVLLIWIRRPSAVGEQPSKATHNLSEQNQLLIMGGLAAVSGTLYFMGLGTLAGLGLALTCLVAMYFATWGEYFDQVDMSERWIGVALVLAAQCMRIFAAMFDLNPVDRVTFVVSVLGLFLIAGGWHIVRWAAPAIPLLLFMFPLPSKVEQTLLAGLQKMAAAASTVVLNTIGVMAVRHESQINIPGLSMPLEVAEACSGMRMLTIFGALTIAMVFFINRPWWDKLIVFLSWIPIALISNISRITITALLFLAMPENDVFHQYVHDYAGYFMMFIGMGLLWLELQILSRLTVPEESVQLKAPTSGSPSAIPVR